MTLWDLLFLASVLFVLTLLGRILILTILRRWRKLSRTAAILVLFLACHAAALIAASLLTPRRILAAGERRCFDDWCVAALTLEPAPAPSCGTESPVWLATFEVSSVARRITQRARDATAELEDTRGQRYSPCAAPAGHLLTDRLGPGESFRVEMPYHLPAGAEPAGLVVHHGAFPGLIIIKDDQSWLHPPALWKLQTSGRTNSGL